MPLFSRHTEPEHEAVPVQPVVEEKPKRHHTIFSKRSPSPPASVVTASTRSSHHTAASQDVPVRRSTERRSLLQRFGNGGNVEMDPSIVHARERVMSAEAAEREADRVLDIARREVREARDQVRKLELEAKEEARLAKIKQYHAKEVSKRGKQLGRHDA